MWIAITAGRPMPGVRQTHHFQIRAYRAGQSVLQSRKLGTSSAAQREAERLFGPFAWMTREQAGFEGQPYVVQIAEYTSADAAAA